MYALHPNPQIWDIGTWPNLKTKAEFSVKMSDYIKLFILSPSLSALLHHVVGSGWVVYCCALAQTAGMPNTTIIETVTMLLLSKQYLFQNIFRKNEIIQSVLIYNSLNIIKTIPVCNHAPVKCASAW